MADSDGRIMLEELQALALLALVVTHSFLVRGCIGIRAELPVQGGEISSRIERTSDLLDEMAQLISDLADTASGANQSAPDVSPIGILLNSFLNRPTMPSEHATPEVQWEIQQDDSNSPPQA